jgi:parvulin-like peptidyl-prolyl isomerase
VVQRRMRNEVRARLIMVDTQDEAGALIKRLQGGDSFGSLASDFNKGRHCRKRR